MTVRRLFDNSGLWSFLDGRLTAATGAAASTAEADFRGHGAEALLERLHALHSLTPLALTKGAISVAMEDLRVDVSQDPLRGISDRSKPVYLPGTRVLYYLPFSGSTELLEYTPGQYTMSFPRAEVAAQELRFIYDTTAPDLGLVKQQYESDLLELERWFGWSQQDVFQFNDRLRTALSGALTQRQSLLTSRERELGAMGLPVRRTLEATFSAVLCSPQSPVPPARRYDVALSFAGEERAYVAVVAEALRANGYGVFFDEFATVALWGSNLVDHLARVYQHNAEFVIMFVSSAYASKAWPTHERQHAQARALVSNGEYILPVRFDDTDIPGLAPTVGFLDARTMKPAQVAEMAARKIGNPRFGA